MKIKVKASITIEAAVIVPLFTIIVVNIIFLAMDCHDETIVNCASDKICMDVEFPVKKSSEYKERITEFEENGRKYIMQKTLRSKNGLEISTDFFNVNSEYSQILKNNPVEFVWVTDAAKKLLGKDK